MHLLHTRTLALKTFMGSERPPYVILSHTWGDDEVSMQDLSLPRASLMSKKGYQKILGCCKRGIEDGYNYAWIDTCCIDKTSSVELSEAINSMYAYYSNSDICYAYLVDMLESDVDKDEVQVSSLAKCRWFTRGWTLQELIAPVTLEFYSSNWKEIGTKFSLAKEIASITGIDQKVLNGSNLLSSYPVATRFSWAADRQTTKIEDSAYCLMGLFNVNMPLIYGEGNGAFHRLQDEILKSTEDHSILAWDLNWSAPRHIEMRPGELDHSLERSIKGIGGQSPQTALAPSVSHFRGTSRYATLKHGDSCSGGSFVDDSPPILTSRGLKIWLGLRHIQGRFYLGYLNTLFNGAPLSALLEKTSENVFCFVDRQRIRLPSKLPSFFCVEEKNLDEFELSSIYIAHNRRASSLQPSTGLGFSQPIVQDLTGVGKKWKVVTGPTFGQDRYSGDRRFMWFCFQGLLPVIAIVGPDFCRLMHVSYPDEILGDDVGKIYSEERNSWNENAMMDAVERLHVLKVGRMDRAMVTYPTGQTLKVSMKRRAARSGSDFIAIFRTTP